MCKHIVFNFLQTGPPLRKPFQAVLEFVIAYVNGSLCCQSQGKRVVLCCSSCIPTPLKLAENEKLHEKALIRRFLTASEMRLCIRQS